MYTIYCKINNDGTMTSKSILPLHVGTKGDRNCTKIKCEIGNLIEGRYQYLKFYHPKSTVLLRLSNNEVVIPSNVTSIAGKWLISFISSTNAVTYSRDTFDYLFSTIPIEAEISNGLMEINILSENEKKIEEQQSQIQSMETLEKDLISMKFQELVIPDYIESIGNYFLYNANNNITKLLVGKKVASIGSYAFYGMQISKILFDEGAVITKFEDYAFSHVYASEILIPRSLTEYGHYAFNGGGVNTFGFERGSNLTLINANAFNGVTIDRLILPDGLKKFAANGYVFRNSNIRYMEIPATLTSNIVQGTFHITSVIEDIGLGSGFNVSCNFSNVSTITHDSIKRMFESLSNRTGLDALSITIGSTNLAKLSNDEIAIATNKNWTVS